MANNPLVSIYTLTYNSSATILETLESIKNLTYENIELIISDDASRDNTVEICTKWINENELRFKRVKFLTVERNTGVAENFHRTIRECKGEWFKGIAGDDALFPNSITELIEFVSQHPEAKMIQGRSARYDTYLTEDHLIEEHGSPDDNLNRVSTAKQQFDILLCWACIDAPAVFYHHSVFEIPELQNCGYAGLEDYPRFLRYTKLGNRIYYCDSLICKYRQSATSVQRTSNYGNLITKSYLAFFFEETHKYYHGLDKIARYVVNYHQWVNCYCSSKTTKSVFNFISYPIYWFFYRIQQKNNYKRINNAIKKG